MKTINYAAVALALIPGTAFAAIDCCAGKECCKDGADCCKDAKRDGCKDMKGSDHSGHDMSAKPKK